MRKNKRSIDFTPQQIAWLKREAKKMGVTVAEFIRYVIDYMREAWKPK